MRNRRTRAQLPAERSGTFVVMDAELKERLKALAQERRAPFAAELEAAVRSWLRKHGA